MAEVWRPVADHPNYEVSDLGRVRSLGLTGRPSRILKPHQKVWPGTDRIYCCTVALGRAKVMRVHRLVLETFVGPCPPGMEGCHNDGDATNNALSNLRWDTRLANRSDMKRHGTHVSRPPKGEASHNARLTEADVRLIRAEPMRLGALKDLAKRFGISSTQVIRIRRRQSWAHVA